MSAAETTPLLGTSLAPAAVKDTTTEGLSLGFRTARAIGIVALLLGLAQVSLSIYAIVRTKDEECDQPLKLFIGAYAARVLLSVPFYGTQRFGIWSPSWGVSGFASFALSTLDVLNLVLFIFGNMWVFSSETCRDTSPWAFWTGYAWIVWEWVAVAVPLTLCFCVPVTIMLNWRPVLSALVIFMTLLRPGSHFTAIYAPVEPPVQAVADNGQPHVASAV
ncbi:hypothetical protein M427DRAFT_40833 [Gonapodya prolifera JEL478]|uniref:Uncharacterized protein n=1 Tax=Gonapodya prolifera (strain JEL478) TaxID=1344416 RepID=A0A139AXN4_GONPJ|nr:hypothetical protein M427DRAFT_40833 [Gonapodya prolifera JEL478]|eukprot:KXS21215.1 hypothetical protein M427DRAFT_40833 [Gonapodya prolifera JEL478]